MVSLNISIREISFNSMSMNRCELRDPAGGVVADIAWNPDQGLHIITASGDDKNPLIKLWDLRSSTTTPLATLHGHTEGILSVSWCPSDPSLLLSCGKDNKTLMWDLFNLQPVYELPCGPAETSQKASTEQGIFGSLATSASHRRYQISWSPCLPAVVAASSFDRRVQFYSVAGARSKIGRAPKWLRKPTGATFGFGGKLVTFNNRAVNAPGEGSSKSVFKIYQVLENKEFDDASGAFHSCLARGEYKEHCERQSREAATEYDRQVWGLMNVICFGANAREELLSFLGFDSSSIAEIASQKIAEADKKNPVPNLVQLALNNKSEPSENLFDVGPPTESIAGVIAPITDSVDIDFTTMSYSEKIKAKDLLATAAAGDAAEPLIRKAIVVGNFELAVEHCLKVGMIAEALLLAQCGDQSLRMKTQAAFFEMQRNKRPFLNVIHAVIKSELLEYVKKSDLSDWKETLALLSTYGKSEEFSSLCEALAERLEQERFDKESAALCYMCAANVLRVIYFWTEQLNKANIQKGHLDTVALQSFVEKVVIFVHANPVDDLGGDCYYNYAKYATLLANQGRLDVALGYLQGSSKEEHILIDRLYHAGSRKAGVKPPAFPFERVSVDVHAKTVTPAAAAAKSAAAAAEAQAKMTKAAASLSSSIDRNDMGKSVNSTPAAATGLPAGWIQLVDPNSGHPYYVNQTTGQSQWEPPAIIAVPERSTLTKSNSSSLSRGAANFGASSSVAAVAAVSVAAMPTTAPTIATPQDGSQVNAENVIVIGQFIEAINRKLSSFNKFL